MSAAEICFLAGAIALVAFTVAFNVVRALRGKTGCGCSGTQKSSEESGVPGCGCSCGSCPYTGKCGTHKDG